MFEILKIGFLNVTAIDLLDIGLITILFFWIYRALKGTIAVQILIGLVIIIGLSFITEAINLKAMNWLLKTISEIWLLAFIILFQPELRRLLMLITRSRIFKIFVKSKISATIDEVIDATIDFSEKHIGALIVFPRTQNVQMTIDTGISLQARVSKELLASIFNTKSPLHDGAVIIDNQLVLAARCVLPLTSLTRHAGQNLGTRHRAALGLSEQIDAVVLVVSEETGAISIADGGILTKNIQREKIKDTLNSKLSEK